MANSNLYGINPMKNKFQELINFVNEINFILYEKIK